MFFSASFFSVIQFVKFPEIKYWGYLTNSTIMAGNINPLFLSGPGDKTYKNSMESVHSARQAMQVGPAFGMPVTHQTAQMANFLPQALQIEEHKNMRKVAAEYHENYVKNFTARYGFKEPEITLLKKDFKKYFLIFIIRVF